MLLQLTRSADDAQRRVDMVRALTDLVVLMRQHIRKCVRVCVVVVMRVGRARVRQRMQRWVDVGASLVTGRRHHFRLRRFLPDFLGLVHDFWSGAPALLLPHVLNLLAELSQTLRDDFRFYM